MAASSLYLVNPVSDFPNYYGAESFAARGLRPATLMADLVIPTLAAMAPPTFDVSLCDENVTPIDWDTPADIIGITGKISQYERMRAIAKAFKKRGKTILLGGPYASLSPEAVRPHCDVLVRGEIEEIAAELFSDLENGTWREEYVGTRPDLAISPVPRWDLYPLERAVMGTLQTSRGCPFECEFCDVIQYAGRKQRHKRVDQVLRELDELYRFGQRTIFLADDNFTVFRSRAKELLVAIRDWNRRQIQGKVLFVTQISIDAARDDELLTLCAEAGLVTVFIGIETPNEEGLRETRKRQNLHVDLVEQVHRILAHGIHVVGGMIVGFDADGPDIFQRQLEFAMDAGIPLVSVGALVAPAATPLHERMRQQGRLKDNRSEIAAVPWSTNIVHPTFTEAQLLGGLQWLSNNLYSPARFGERLITMIGKLGKRRDPRWGDAIRLEDMRGVDQDCYGLLGKVPRLGPEEEKMWTRVMAAVAKKPETREFVNVALIQYMQVRYMYDRGQFWEPRLADPKANAPAALTALRIPSRASTSETR